MRKKIYILDNKCAILILTAFSVQVLYITLHVGFIVKNEIVIAMLLFVSRKNQFSIKHKIVQTAWLNVSAKLSHLFKILLEMILYNTYIHVYMQQLTNFN